MLVKTLVGITTSQHPYRPETNGIAEGTSAFLGSVGSFRKVVGCHLRNIQDKLADWKSPHDRWFGAPFDGPVKDV